MRLKGALFGREPGLRTCPVDFDMQQLQSFDIAFDPAPDHPRIAQVGKSADSAQPQRETRLCREDAPESLDEKWNGTRVYFSQELQGQVDILNQCPAHVGARIPERTL